jgi:hypothetical protein
MPGEEGIVAKSSHPGRVVGITVGLLILIAAVWLLTGNTTCRFHPERCACSPIPDPDPPCTINVVLDTSESMRGYFEGQTEFKDVLSRLASALDKFKTEPAKPHCPSAIAFQYYNTNSGTLVPAAADSREFNNALLNDAIPSGTESPLQNMLEMVVDESSGAATPVPPDSDRPKQCPVAPSDSVLSILVTDSIFSYSDEEIAKNREVNKDNIKGLAEEVGIIFNKAHALDKSASILAFKSQFHGTYFNYRNGRSTWGSVPRPYYFWVIGSATNVRAVRSFLQAESIIPDHALDFVIDPFDLSSTILQYTDRKGTWNRHNDESPLRIHVRKPFLDDRDKSSGPDNDSRGEIGFAVGLDLSHLSPDQLSGDYLTKHLRVESQSPDLEIKSVAIKTRAEIEADLNPRDRGQIPHATHFVLITTDFKFIKTARLSISIDDALPSWYLDWSNEDDTQTDQRTLETTFGLRYFVEAIARAYDVKGPIAKTTILLER